MIELGSKVKCKYTGFTGIAMIRSEFINGCTQYEVAPRVKKDGAIVEGMGIDEQSLIVVAKPKKDKPKPKKKTPRRTTGGPNTKSMMTTKSIKMTGR